jgi:hypothetical protein
MQQSTTKLTSTSATAPAVRLGEHTHVVSRGAMRAWRRELGALLPSLEAAVGPLRAEAISESARQRYFGVLARLPERPDAPVYGDIVRATAVLVALYSVARDDGVSLPEFWQITEKANADRFAKMPRLVRWAAGRAMLGWPARWWFRRAAVRSQTATLAGFAFDYVLGDDASDFGINYTSCPLGAMAAREGVAELGPWICELDRVSSEAMGWGLSRTGTLAQGARCCDFRFKKGGATDVAPPPHVEESR